jgi:predicted nucleic acid-binding protein
MTSQVVADSGLLIATAFEETYSEKAAALWEYWDDSQIIVFAPNLFRFEIVAAVRKHVYRATIPPDVGLTIRDEFLSKKVQLKMNDGLLRRGYELASQFNRPTAYDSQYLAVAEHLGCEFWTTDERMFSYSQWQPPLGQVGRQFLAAWLNAIK